MKPILVLSAKQPVKPAKKVKASELFADEFQYKQLELLCEYLKKEGSFGELPKKADKILTQKYSESPTGLKELRDDIQFVYDMAVRALEADRKSILGALLKG